MYKDKRERVPAIICKSYTKLLLHFRVYKSNTKINIDGKNEYQKDNNSDNNINNNNNNSNSNIIEQ